MSQFDWLVAAFPWTVFTAFDTETTGLEPKLNRVVEAGAIRFDSIGVSARFNALINPMVPMPSEVTKINGITDAMLKKEPPSGEVLPDFMEFIGDTPIIAHNAPFDVAFINEELSRLGKPPLKNRVIDTRIFAKELFPSLQSYRLQDLARHFSITAIDAHRAEDDARVCMELFLVCLARLKETRPDLVQAASAASEGAKDAAQSQSQSAPQGAAKPSGDPVAASATPQAVEAAASAPKDEGEPWQDELFAEEEDSEEYTEEEP
ncbi:MAG TPA: exonuclease domain-containing protein [Treponemataceae bacterium]|nr:exonuclease domain-containing protein [Treponemataceae bacterium]